MASTLNQLLTCPADCDTDLDLGAIDLIQDCTKIMLNDSQITDLVLLPSGAAAPADWTAALDWAGVIDNSNTDSTKAKHLVGIGGIAAPEKRVVAMPKRRQKIKERVYTLPYRIQNLSDAQYAFLRQIQCNDTSFTFWYGNSAHLFGGATGLIPLFIDVDFVYSEDDNGIEEATLTITWRSDGDPLRATNPIA